MANQNIYATTAIFSDEYACKHTAHLFYRHTLDNRFVEQEKELLLALGLVIKEVLPTPLPAWVSRIPRCRAHGGTCTYRLIDLWGKNAIVSVVYKIPLKKRALRETTDDELRYIAQTERSRRQSLNKFIDSLPYAIAGCDYLESNPPLTCVL